MYIDDAGCHKQSIVVVDATKEAIELLERGVDALLADKGYQITALKDAAAAADVAGLAGLLIVPDSESINWEQIASIHRIPIIVCQEKGSVAKKNTDNLYYFTKPFNDRDFMDTVAQAVTGRRPKPPKLPARTSGNGTTVFVQRAGSSGELSAEEGSEAGARFFRLKPGTGHAL